MKIDSESQESILTDNTAAILQLRTVKINDKLSTLGGAQSIGSKETLNHNQTTRQNSNWK